MASMSIFQIFPLENPEEFPFFSKTMEPGQEWSAVEAQQPALNAELDNIPKSLIRFLGLSAHNDFYKYHGFHEVKKQRRGRYYNEVFSAYIEIREFDVYLPQDLHALYMCTGRKTAHAFVRRLAQRYPFSYNTIHFNLERIQEEFRVRGGWFTNLKIPSITSAALYGVDVEGSRDWSRYSQHGRIASVVIEATVKDAIFEGLEPVEIPIVASVTRLGSITLYGNYSERERLVIIQAVKQMLEPFIEAQPPRGKR